MTNLKKQLTGNVLDKMLADVVPLAQKAGRVLMEGLSKKKQIDYKGEVDLVTEYDKRCEQLIVEELLVMFPGHGILAEEGGTLGDLDSDYLWIIDPLDGTTNYAHGHPWFAVSIGLEYKGELVLGVVEIPFWAQTVKARKNGGAFVNDKKISVSGVTSLDKALVATGYPYDRRTAADDNTAENYGFIKSSQGVRRCGAAAVDLAFVAMGIYDGYWEPRLKPWDLAAGVVIVREAGGQITAYDGSVIQIREGWVIASNGVIGDQMVDIISKIRFGKKYD